jgi:hypothetical protein
MVEVVLFLCVSSAHPVGDTTVCHAGLDLKMRLAGVDIAIVTATGRLESPDDMIGVIDWHDIADTSDIPLPMLTGQRAAPKPTPPSTPHN